MPTTPPLRLRTTCNRDCPDVCSILATVDEGRVTRLEGDPDHPITRGFLCHRTSRFLERQYSPTRLTTPLVRDGDGFRPIGWDAALDRIAQELLRIRAESGPAAILHYRSGGSLGLMKHAVDAFFERFGPVTVKEGDICSGAGDAAQATDFGDEDSSDLEDLLNARTIVLWGKNPVASNPHLVPLLREAKSRGARLVSIDPVRHRGAELAHLVLQPRPGGDAALALGVARLLFERGATDPDAATYCNGLEGFCALAFSRDLDGYAELADVRPAEIEALADAYAAGPSAILVGWGLGRRANGSTTIRVLDALCAVAGHLGVPGGGVSYSFKRRGAFDLSFCTGAAARRLSEPRLGPAILEARDPPIRAVWVTAGNPVAMLPESGTVARALRTRELVVVVDSFMTDTAQQATFVLPTTTLLEDDDLLGSYGHAWLGESRPVVAPPPGVRSDHAILQALAPRLGLGAPFDEPVETWKRRLLAKVAGQGASLDDLRRGPVRNPLSPRVAFADRRFRTPSGKVELVTHADLEPPRPSPERPLLLMALSTEKAQASQAIRPHETAGWPEAVVHPDAAQGLASGSVVWVESAVGRLRAVLRTDPRERRDVLRMAKGGSLASGCPNALVAATETDAGQGAVYYDTPVRILPCRED